ncbi:MAG: translation initiation factor IF-2 subunit alpha [Candidatus Thermoplasmatota archaeon]|jgi:translation initiation factor 2 subunit 1|nr:translation initiation factor IF-2 subunit alpha [Candidatus Thermoplasmatota archaeon]MCL5963255.1 translation initiation factor IF-2 subunit alpha [Candidatus Thermoplasmatota archaeon]
MGSSDNNYPEVGEHVVCTVKNVKNYGAFVILDEYKGKEGFIHLTEISTGWVKYIRDFVREGQKIVCKVIGIDPSKGHIDLSLKQINDHQKREKISSWKNEQRASKLMNIVIKNINVRPEDISETITKLIKEYGTLYSVFENARSEPDSLSTFIKDKKFFDEIIKISMENLSIPEVSISGIISLTFLATNGIVLIKEIIKKAMNIDPNIDIKYAGGGKYRIVVTANDYKSAEATLKNVTDLISTYAKTHKGIYTFTREGR